MQPLRLALCWPAMSTVHGKSLGFCLSENAERTSAIAPSFTLVHPNEVAHLASADSN